MPKLILTQDVLAESGLDVFTPGDTVYLPVKATIIGKNGEVTGIKVDGLGPISENSATEFVDAYGEDNNKDLSDKTEEAQEGEAVGEETDSDANNGMADTGDDATTTGESSKKPDSMEANAADAGSDVVTKSEEKILGYKRPRGKKVKLPRASDIFGQY